MKGIFGKTSSLNLFISYTEIQMHNISDAICPAENRRSAAEAVCFPHELQVTEPL